MDAPNPHDYGRTHQLVTIGDPAAASGFVHVVPGAIVQRVVCVFFQLVTDANAADRVARVEYFDGVQNTFFAVAAPFVVTASGGSRYSFGVGVQQFGADDAAFIGAGLPDLPLGDGLAVGVNIQDMQAGDQLSSSFLFVDQWPVRD